LGEQDFLLQNVVLITFSLLPESLAECVYKTKLVCSVFSVVAESNPSTRIVHPCDPAEGG